METFNSYCVIIGIGAIGVGLYVLFTKKLLGRNTGSASKETIQKFLPIEVATYIILGLLMALMGLPQYFPFVENPIVITVLVVLSLAVVAVNVILGRKFFPDAKAPDPRNQGPRLK